MKEIIWKYCVYIKTLKILKLICNFLLLRESNFEYDLDIIHILLFIETCFNFTSIINIYL